MLRLGDAHRRAIAAHGEKAYPREACGALLGTSRGEEKRVEALLEAANRFGDVDGFREGAGESRANRYVIPPGDVARIEAEARRRGLDVVGFYHSHPDHPARPSTYDQDHAWPWLSYVIVRVAQGKALDLNSFVLTDDRARMDPEEVR